MTISVEKTSNLGRRLTIEVPAAHIKSEEQNRIKDLAKTMRIEGFRRGKVPANFIQQKYGAQIHQEAVTKVLQDSLGDALKEQNLRPANRPTVEDLNDIKDQNLKYTVTFEVYPEVVLGDFTRIELEKQVATITDADVDSGVQKLQDQFATWIDVTDRPAQNGDKLVIDFVGLLNGEPFENGSANEQAIELGSNTFIPGFEEALVGVKVGDDTTINVTFPTDYGAENLAGKPAQFNIQVKSMQAKTPATVDEAFAERIGITDKDVTKVRERVRDNMVKYIDDLTKTRLRTQVLDKLYAIYPLEIPQSLLDEETHNLLHEKQGHANKHDHTLEDHKHDDLTPEQMTELRAEAKKRISIGLILHEIISKYKIEPAQDRMLAKIDSMSLMYGGRADFMRKMFQDSKELRQSIQNMVLTDQAADMVVANATIKESQAGFYDIVNRAC